MLSRITDHLAAHWKRIGYELLELDDVESIDSTAKTDDKKCLDMLIKWLKTDPSASYSKLVHKQMFYIRTNLQMLQHSNVKCNIRMFILRNKMMYFGDLWSLSLTLALNLYLSHYKHKHFVAFV